MAAATPLPGTIRPRFRAVRQPSFGGMSRPILGRMLLDIGGPLHVVEWPGPPGATIVCLHAVGGSALHWRVVAPRLARHGRVLAVDQIGFGQTPRAGRSAGVEGAQQVLARLLRETSAEPAVLIGHSMGSAVAVLQAVREPVSVRALVLTSALLPPSYEGVSDRVALARFLVHRAALRAGGARRALGRRSTLERVIGEGLRGAAADPGAIDAALVRDSIELARAAGLRETTSSFAQAARSTFGLVTRVRTYRQMLDRIGCPVLLLHGGRDRTVPLSFAERVARDHPGWQLEVFPELGHLLQLEDPARWSDAIERWLERL
jgi:pimeloyl-ACP methyl ester carboxylesterase